MKVGLNLIFLVPGETGGMETYARELLPELVGAAPTDRFTAFINREAAAEPDAPWGSLIPAVTVPVNARRRTEWVRGEQWFLPQLARQAGVDLVHSLASTAPGWGRFRRVVTIHDVNYRTVPESHLGAFALGMRVLVPLAARRSHRIIVPSRATKDDLVSLERVAADKIDVIPEGVGAQPRGRSTAERELRELLQAGSRPIALSVSAQRPHKNLMRLIDALALIPRERRPLLVIPGYSTRYGPRLVAHAEALGLAEDLRLLGWVDAAQLEGLYEAAACFIFPSLYEGFGLPVLEAMARGVPVACSGRGALDEVVGDAALRFDPEDRASIASTITRLLDDPSEAARLVTAGRRRAQQYTWSTTAAATIASYQRALSSPR